MSISFLPQIALAEGADPAPLVALRDGDPLEVNVSNANGAELLAALGLPAEPCGGPVPLAEFRSRVAAALRRRMRAGRSPAVPPREDRAPGAMPVVLLGRREGYVEERLGDLARLARRAGEAGATHVVWG